LCGSLHERFHARNLRRSVGKKEEARDDSHALLNL
jgi:hypothetical protein